MLTQKDLDEIEQIIEEKLDQKIKFLPTKDDFYTKIDELKKMLRYRNYSFDFAQDFQPAWVDM